MSHKKARKPETNCTQCAETDRAFLKLSQKYKALRDSTKTTIKKLRKQLSKEQRKNDKLKAKITSLNNELTRYGQWKMKRRTKEMTNDDIDHKEREKSTKMLVCQQANWNAVIYDETTLSFAGYKSNPFKENQLQKWWMHITTSKEIRWNRPPGLPRQCAWLVNKGCQCIYKYSGTFWKPNTFPSWFEDMTQHVLEETGLEFENPPNSCNVNWYLNGRDSCGWHADDECLFESLYNEALILSLSLGQNRIFQMKRNTSNEVEKEIILYHGDLLSMEGFFQKYYLHRVPKQFDIVNCNARINFTWRWITKHNCFASASCSKGTGQIGSLT
eukprot:203201_1